MPHLTDQLFEGCPIGHRAVGLVALAGLADGGVEFRPFLGLVLGLEEVARGEGIVEGFGLPRIFSLNCPPSLPINSRMQDHRCAVKTYPTTDGRQCETAGFN